MFCGALLSSSFIGGPPMAAIEALAGRNFVGNGFAFVSNAEKVFRAWSGSYFGLEGCGVRKPVGDGTETCFEALSGETLPSAGLAFSFFSASLWWEKGE
jgi:hypothetical protein